MDPTFEERKPEMERLITVVMQMWEENPGNWKQYVTKPKEMSTLFNTKYNTKVGLPKIQETWGHLSAYIQKEETWNAVLEMFSTDFLKNIDFNEFHHSIHEFRYYLKGKEIKFVRQDLPPELRITPRVRAQNAVIEFKSKSNPAETIAKIQSQLVKEQSKVTSVKMQLKRAQDELGAAQSEKDELALKARDDLAAVQAEKNELALEIQRLKKTARVNERSKAILLEENDRHLIDQHAKRSETSTLQNKLDEALKQVSSLEEQKHILEELVKKKSDEMKEVKTDMAAQKKANDDALKLERKKRKHDLKQQESRFETAMKALGTELTSRHNEFVASQIAPAQVLENPNVKE